MNKTSNKKLTGISKILRKNMTPEEKHLWYDFLKALPYTVNRQKVIGAYVIDFYCAASKTAIEIDGSQHYEPRGKYEDGIRDEYLKNLGITVLRYSNIDIHQNFDSVCADILQHISCGNTDL